MTDADIADIKSSKLINYLSNKNYKYWITSVNKGQCGAIIKFTNITRPNAVCRISVLGFDGSYACSFVYSEVVDIYLAYAFNTKNDISNIINHIDNILKLSEHKDIMAYDYNYNMLNLIDKLD